MFYLLDFATGTIAFKVEAKEKENKSIYWVESGKIMRGIIKLVVYFQIILLSFVAEKILVKSEFVVQTVFFIYHLLKSGFVCALRPNL